MSRKKHHSTTKTTTIRNEQSLAGNGQRLLVTLTPKAETHEKPSSGKQQREHATGRGKREAPSLRTIEGWEFRNAALLPSRASWQLAVIRAVTGHYPIVVREGGMLTMSVPPFQGDPAEPQGFEVTAVSLTQGTQKLCTRICAFAQKRLRQITEADLWVDGDVHRSLHPRRR